MINREINYSEFIKYVHKRFEDSMSFTEIEKFLYLEEDYNMDSPHSVGKRLLINRLRFNGTKVNGQEILYDQFFYSGINVWIADNGRGKSTIFKIIKFALTGKDSIKGDIKSWIDEVLLEFEISNEKFTISIDKRTRTKGALYNLSIEDFLKYQENKKLDQIDTKKEFDFKSNLEFEEKIQKFFFDNFTYYSLKFTKHKSAKDDYGLETANLSWLTYFKSIYLESKNYEYLFFDQENMGAQGRKIFEMILGLPLTYPINRLTIQKDKIFEEIGKLRAQEKNKIEKSKDIKETILAKLRKVEEELNGINKNVILNFDEKPLLEEYNIIQQKLNDSRKLKRQYLETFEKNKQLLESIDLEVFNLKKDKKGIADEILKLEKNIVNFELYISAGSFFTNLEIKTCPHCEEDVSKRSKTDEIESHKCSLCGETPTHQKVEVSELQSKVDKLLKEKEELTPKIPQIEKLFLALESKYESIRILQTELYSKIISIPSDDKDNKRLQEIEEKITQLNNGREKLKEEIGKRETLIKEEAVLKFQISQIENENSKPEINEYNDLLLKKEIIEFSLSALEKKRKTLNQDILDKLSNLILNEINAFGLTNISNIDISDKYDLIITQNNVKLAFSELNEGEKLRVKLAFYLSIIQLDIEFSLGRHPRFLIFDSPGGEEMVPKHLSGLADILKSVNERFNDKLQIFIGSALKEFSGITETKKAFIKQEDEFVF